MRQRDADFIRDPLGQNLRAFGAGTSASLLKLQVIDSNAQIFETVDELLDVFGEAGAGSNMDTKGTTVTVNNVAPTITGVMADSIVIDDDDDNGKVVNPMDDEEGCGGLGVSIKTR